MSLSFDDYFIRETAENDGVTSLPDRPIMTATELKARFDFLASAITDAHNGLVAFLQSPDLTDGLYAYDSDGKAVLLSTLIRTLTQTFQSLSETGAAANIGTDNPDMSVQNYIDLFRDYETLVGAEKLGAKDTNGNRISIQVYLDKIAYDFANLLVGVMPDESVTMAKLAPALKQFVSLHRTAYCVVSSFVPYTETSGISSPYRGNPSYDWFFPAKSYTLYGDTAFVSASGGYITIPDPGVYDISFQMQFTDIGETTVALGWEYLDSSDRFHCDVPIPRFDSLTSSCFGTGHKLITADTGFSVRPYFACNDVQAMEYASFTDALLMIRKVG